DSTVHIPDAYIVGAARDDSAAYFVGKEIARKMRLLGAHVNMSSFADIYSNFRDSLSQYSFGQNGKRVASKAVAFMKGLQDNGVLAVVKNFTINGATVLDVKDDVPVIAASIDSAKSFPFLRLFENKVSGFMPAESSFPLFYQDMDLVKKNNLDVAAISSLLSGDWMREKQGYNGLIWVALHQKNNSDE